MPPRYGTFGYLCEELINQRGSIRTMAQSYAAGDAELQGRERLPNARPQVLMIDEVDVFVGARAVPCVTRTALSKNISIF